MKSLVIELVKRIHYFLFGQEMSVQMKNFMGNLSWSFFAGIIAMPISMLVGTLAGRLMGPVDYGRYNLVVLISSYVVAFAYFGLDISSLKRIVKSKSLAEQRTSFYSAFIFIVFMLAIFTVISFSFGPAIIAKTDLPKNIIYFIIFYTIVNLIKSITDVLVRATERFKLQAISRLIEVFILTAVFLVVVFLYKILNYELYLVAIILGMVISLIYYIRYLRQYFGGFSFDILKKQLSEGKFFMLSGILSTFFISSDRLLIAKYLDITNLGIYSAYYVASLGLVAPMSLILINVFLPATARSIDKSFTKKLDKLLFKGFVPIYLSLCFAIYIFLNLFGKAYPLRLSYLLLFALAATLYFFSVIYNVVILDAGRNNYIQYFYLSTIINLLTIGYYFVILQSSFKSVILVLVGFSTNLLINLIIQLVFVRIMREKRLHAQKV